MPDTQEHLAGRLANDGQRSIEFFTGLSPFDWEVLVYTDKQNWTVSQILAHFVSAESGNLKLIQDILAGGEGVSSNFDIDRFNDRALASYPTIDPARLLEDFVSQRKITVSFVQDFQPGDLLLVGRHPFLGLAPVGEIIKLIYRHNQIHIRDIRKVLET